MLGVAIYMATRCDWLRIARGDRIVFYICWVSETGVDAISAYLKVKLVLPRSLRPIVLKRSKNAITIEVVTFKFGYYKIPLCNFEFNCRQIDNNRVQLRDYFLATYGSIAFFVTRSFCEHHLTCKDPQRFFLQFRVKFAKL